VLQYARQDENQMGAFYFSKSTGEPEGTVAPNSAKRAFILESTRAVLVNLLSIGRISGVFFGATRPCQELAS
jgi:hypothetical protein